MTEIKEPATAHIRQSYSWKQGKSNGLTVVVYPTEGDEAVYPISDKKARALKIHETENLDLKFNRYGFNRWGHRVYEKKAYIPKFYQGNMLQDEYNGYGHLVKYYYRMLEIDYDNRTRELLKTECYTGMFKNGLFHGFGTLC